MTEIEEIQRKLEALRRKASRRDKRMRDVHDVRAGDVETIMPGAFPDAWPKPVVANYIDLAARSLAEIIAPLPSINCSSGNMTSERGKNFASKRTKIAASYVNDSNLKVQMAQAADWYISYGQVAFIIEPDFESKVPYIRVENPMKTYPEYDIRGRVRSYAKVWREEAHSLAAKYPQHTRLILGDDDQNYEAKLEVVKYCDADRYLMYLPERNNTILDDIPNPFKKVPVVIASRPSFDDDVRGQFDDVIWVQLARARMALLAMEATEKTVGAPLALPTDVQKVSFGKDATIRSNSPEKIRYVGIDVPQATFSESAQMQQEIQAGTRLPAARSGDLDASIITGKGVQALMGGFDSQVRQAQTMLGRALEQTLMLCFEMDEKFWPDTKKLIRGQVQGTPFEENYIAGKDINGSHTVDVSYGFASGLDPSRALVFLLQLRGDQDISRDFLQRQLPMEIDVAQMQAQIDMEQTTDALKQGIFAMLQSMGILAQQGADPSDLLFRSAKLIELREKGKSMSEAIMEAFAPKETPQPKGAPAEPAPADAEAAAAGGPLPGMQASGLPFGVAPGQAGMGEGGRPDIQTILAGLTSSGQPSMSSSVKRQVPA